MTNKLGLYYNCKCRSCKGEIKFRICDYDKRFEPKRAEYNITCFECNTVNHFLHNAFEGKE